MTSLHTAQTGTGNTSVTHRYMVPDRRPTQDEVSDEYGLGHGRSSNSHMRDSVLGPDCHKHTQLGTAIAPPQVPNATAELSKGSDQVRGRPIPPSEDVLTSSLKTSNRVATATRLQALQHGNLEQANIAAVYHAARCGK